MSNIAYEAVNEDVRVFVAFGKTPAKALKNMAKIIESRDIRYWSAASVDTMDDGLFYINIYV